MMRQMVENNYGRRDRCKCSLLQI